jgi:magnesium transporter
MIDLFLSTGEIKRLNSITEISTSEMDFSGVQFLDYSKSDVEWVEANFGIDCSIMNQSEDFEISSHFFESSKQASFHFSLPYFTEKEKMVEESVFLLATHKQVFWFTSAALDNYLTDLYSTRLPNLKMDQPGVADLLMKSMEFLAGYYADITENVAKRIKSLANQVLIEKEFKNSELDTITLYKFNNLLIKESLNEFARILTLYRKSNRQEKLAILDRIQNELTDLSVVSDYIQFNFDRLDDLEENISNKIELEQNKIFKALTIITACIAMPTLIAGIYGMNFEIMPELKWMWGYPFALCSMFLSVLLPLLFFKRKKWL